MNITVNEVVISVEEIEREMSLHARASDPRRAAIEALVLREVLRQEAHDKLAEATAVKQQAVNATSSDAEAFIEETMVERLIEREVVKPVLADEECLAYYRLMLSNSVRAIWWKRAISCLRQNRVKFHPTCANRLKKFCSRYCETRNSSKHWHVLTPHAPLPQWGGVWGSCHPVKRYLSLNR